MDDVLEALRRALAARQARGMAQEYLEVREVAALLHVHRYTIYQYIRTGRLPAMYAGRKYLIPVAALERLVQEAIEAVRQ